MCVYICIYTYICTCISNMMKGIDIFKCVYINIYIEFDNIPTAHTNIIIVYFNIPLILRT